ncbi:MAG: SDR family NAD(P)-dependent oxidoreductase [Planctomycetota bacterium]
MERRTALVTGANRGIGFEIASQLAARGHRVVVACRSLADGEAAAARIAASGAADGGALAVRCDVADRASIRACAAELAARGVEVDVLVNNAGVYTGGDVLTVDERELDEALAVNFEGPLHLCRAFVPAMVRRGFGRIVDVSSGGGQFANGLTGRGPYALAKAALGALTLRISTEVRGDVLVNAMCPGWVRTRMGGDEAPRSVEEGADTAVWLATLPRGGPNGGFFRDRKLVPW